VENYCAARQATDGKIIRRKRIRFAYGISQAKTQTRAYKF